MNNNINTLLNEISYKINGDEFDKTLDILDNILKKVPKNYRADLRREKRISGSYKIF